MFLLSLGCMLSGLDVLLHEHLEQKKMREIESCCCYSLTDSNGVSIRFTVTPLLSRNYLSPLPSICPVLETDWVDINDCKSETLVRAFDLLCVSFARYYYQEMGELMIEALTANGFEYHSRKQLDRFITNVLKDIIGESFYVLQN